MVLSLFSALKMHWTIISFSNLVKGISCAFFRYLSLGGPKWKVLNKKDCAFIKKNVFLCEALSHSTLARRRVMDSTWKTSRFQAKTWIPHVCTLFNMGEASAYLYLSTLVTVICFGVDRHDFLKGQPIETDAYLLSTWGGECVARSAAKVKSREFTNWRKPN